MTISKQTFAAKSRKIVSVEELVLICERGIKIYCPDDICFEKPKHLPNVLDLSTRRLLWMIKKGLYAVGEDNSEPEGSVLSNAKSRIRALGLSHDEIAKMAGVTRQAVQHFMSSASVQTRVLDKYLNALGI